MTLPIFTETPAVASAGSSTGTVGQPHQVAAGEPSRGSATSTTNPAVPMLEIHVFGQPAAQGSKRHVGHGVMVESSKKLKPWREAVKQATLDRLDLDWIQRNGPLLPKPSPVNVHIIFTFIRPKSHYRTGRNAHMLRDDAPARPVNTIDVDKGLRACFDALTDAGAWGDDKQVVDCATSKVYPGTHPDALPVAGAVIRIYRAVPTPIFFDSNACNSTAVVQETSRS